MHSVTSTIHPKEKFNKKLVFLGKMFLYRKGEERFITFEDDYNIIQLKSGYYDEEHYFIHKPDYYYWDKEKKTFPDYTIEIK